MPAFRDLTGEQFGRITVLHRAENRGKQTFWLCECSCGSTKEICAYNLTKGLTKSCGCLSAEMIGERSRTHGMTESREYQIWLGMKARCHTESNRAYKYYGAKGVSVCDAWFNSFEQFLADMGVAPEGASIDRVDVRGNYEPSNCRWATAEEQANNKSNNRRITWQGKTMTAAQWGRELGLKQHTILRRLRDGWTVPRALTVKNGSTGAML